MILRNFVDTLQCRPSNALESNYFPSLNTSILQYFLHCIRTFVISIVFLYGESNIQCFSVGCFKCLHRSFNKTYYFGISIFVDTGDCSLLTLVLYFTDLSKDYVTMFQYLLMNFVIFRTLQLFVMYI